MSKSYVFVKYVRGAKPELDSYSYGVVGNIPVMQLIGYIVRVQAELAFRSPEACDGGLCIINYDPTIGLLTWAVDSCIPVDQLVGMLELIKSTLVDSQISLMAQSKILT